MSQFRVLQLNMQFGQTWDAADPDHAPIDLARTLAELRAHEADIILLQEVEKAAADGRQVDPPPNFSTLRAGLADYDSYFAYPKPDRRELPFGIGLAIFSRTPLRRQTRLDLPSPPVPFHFRGQTLTPTDRLLIGAATTIAGHDLQLFNTHLLAFFMLGENTAEDPQQRELVVRELASSNGPTLLAGDFNVRDHEALVRQFRPAGFTSVQTTEVTWRRMPFVLDHVFYNSGVCCVSHRVVPTPASDHHLLVADFTFV